MVYSPRGLSVARSVTQDLTGARDIRLGHPDRVDDAIEFRFVDEAEGQRGLLEGEVVVHRMMRDFRTLCRTR